MREYSSTPFERCRVLVMDTRSPFEDARGGGSSSFIRTIWPHVPSDWWIAAPAPAQPLNGPVHSEDRILELGPPLRRSPVPERVRIAVRVLKWAASLRKLNPQVVYCHSNEIAMAHVLLGRRLLPGSAFVLHQHGAENPLRHATYDWARRGPFISTYERLLRATHRRSDLVVVIDSMSRSKNEGWGLAGKIFLLPNAVDLQRFHPEPVAAKRGRSEWGLPEKAHIFLHAGRLEEVKRQIVIIEGFEKWSSDPLRQGCLVLVGEGSLESRLRERIQLSRYRDRIHFLGFISPERMPDLLRAADSFVLASEFEGVPMVLLEALATGIPVIAPAVGGIPDVLSASMGVLVPPSPTPQDLCHAMDSAATTRWDAPGIRGYAQRFGAGEAVSALEQQFNLLLAAPKRNM